MSNPYYPDWYVVLTDIRRIRRWSDDAICDELSKMGIEVERTALARLRSGESKNPLYPLGAGLIILHEDALSAEPPPEEEPS